MTKKSLRTEGTVFSNIKVLGGERMSTFFLIYLTLGLLSCCRLQGATGALQVLLTARQGQQYRG